MGPGHRVPRAAQKKTQRRRGPTSRKVNHQKGVKYATVLS